MCRRFPLPKNATSRRNLRLHVEHLETRVLLTATLSEAFTLVNEIAPSPVDATNYLQPRDYAPFVIDHAALATQLSGAPMEFNSATANPVRLDIPGPDGSVQSFDIVTSPVMAPELAAKFPQINTYRGVGVTDATASIRLDLTPQGFHAQVLSPNGGYYIDPFYHLDTSAYVSYFIFDAGVDAETQAVRDGLTEQLFGHDGTPINLDSEQAISHDDDRPPLEGELDSRDHSNEHTPDVHDDHVAHGVRVDEQDDNGAAGTRFIGETLRTYRLANAATAEYTIFHGGTVMAGQSAIVTAINRVTGVYENDFAIRLELVANNDQLVYTSNPDPYSNNNAGAMLGQNQSNLDTVIGSANYDIGHVFSRGGGGVAGLGVVGNNFRKAEGVSGLGSPIGDPFSVDYVSHEMGHQFDGLHTFNGCGAGGGGGSSSYEPGSASTIMGYAGICGGNNLQSNSDPYFHWKNLNEVRSFVNNQIPNVGTTMSTGNTDPMADAGADYAIPTETPFRLTGAGSDIDPADLLTYTWEQADRGPALTLSQPDNGSSPIFRSWLGTTDPVRVVPRLNELLNNTTPVGERYATVPRFMDWRLTVRDNAPGGGGHAIDAMRINIVDTGSPFQVASPNTSGVTWAGNTTENIAWDVAGTDGGAINTPNVNIRLSTDGGQTYPITLAENVANDGSHDILVPNIDTNGARVMVEGAGNIFFDLSNFDLSIEMGTLLGDFDGNGELDCADVDELTIALAGGSTNPIYDLNGDSLVNNGDLTEWVVNLKGTLMGDANLDFVVDGSDFIAWNDNRFEGGTAWCSGDFNADGFTDGSDFIIWNHNRFQNAIPPSGLAPTTAVADSTEPAALQASPKLVSTASSESPPRASQSDVDSPSLARRIAAQTNDRKDGDHVADKVFASYQHSFDH
jgi:hypothetical protein